MRWFKAFQKLNLLQNLCKYLFQIMRMEFEEEANRKNKAPLLLTAAVGVGEDIIDNSYNITEISK